MTIGIYCIRNKIDDKKYIGKSINIEHRFSAHRTALIKSERNKKKTNRHLYNSVQKYGLDNFEFTILEVLPEIDEQVLRDRELYWMDFYRSCERDFGYNLRRDSSTASFVHDETRCLLSEINSGEGNPNYDNKWSEEQKSRMSEIKSRQFRDGMYDWMKSPEWKAKLSENSKLLWKDEAKKAAMAEKVAEARSILKFYQYCKISGELIREWDSIREIMLAHPDWHDKAIYGVCSGHKKSYRGFIWRSEEKML